MDSLKIKEIVQEKYGSVARSEGGCGCGCGDQQVLSKNLGYSDEELKIIPDQANLGLGCGNPTAIGSLKPGEVVLDLGSGAGMDCFLAATKVGESGIVIGVDMTPDMVAKARQNVEKAGTTNIEFRLGDIENLPVEDNSVDVVISNCVINLVPDKKKAFAEVFRVLKPGGRVMISDIALDGELPAKILASAEAYVGCIAGAIQIQDYLEILQNSGFEEPAIDNDSANLVSCLLADPDIEKKLSEWDLTREQVEDAARTILSVKIQASKPVG